MVTQTNELTALAKHIYKSKYRFDEEKRNSDQRWNNDKCRCECKNAMNVKKIIFRTFLHVTAKMGNSWQVIWMACDIIAFDKVIEPLNEITETIPKHFN